MPVMRADWRVRRMEGDGESGVLGLGRRGERVLIKVRRVWRGRSGSQVSSQRVLGSKAPVVELKAVV